MKKSTIALFLLIAMVLMGCSSHNQRGTDGRKPDMKPPTAEERIKTLTAELNLSDDQVSQITPVLKTSFEKHDKLMQAIRDGDSDDRKKNREALEDLEWETYKRFSEILTPEQMEKYSDFLEKEQKMRQSHRPPSGGPGAGPRGSGSSRF